MKIIDYDKKGNVIRFYLGEDNCEDYWGDDWDDRGCTDAVYTEYIKGWVDIAFPFDYYVLDVMSDWGWYETSSFSKEDLKKKKSPCIIVCKADPDEYFDDKFAQHALDANAIKFYFNDDSSKIEYCGEGRILQWWDK